MRSGFVFVPRIAPMQLRRSLAVSVSTIAASTSEVEREICNVAEALSGHKHFY